MGRTKINRAVSHHIPNIDITCMRTKKSIERNGKYVLKIDDSWQFATSDINEGFKKYNSNPQNPEENGINKKGKAVSTLNFKKTDYDFEGILDYSLDLQHLIDYCDSKRKINDYFYSSKSKNYCLALVKVNFERNTKDVREFLYRPEGFTITYSFKENKPITIQYERYKRTASGAREGSCLFIAKDLYVEMMKWSIAGLTAEKAKQIDAVSWEAYISLTLSAIETTINLNPRQILFIEDKEAIVKDGKAYELTSVKGKLTVNNRIYAENNENAIENKNTIWDGEGLIDDSLFCDNPVLSDQYADKCMLLLRGKFFKACVFRTHIQKWFADNNIKNINQLNGYTQAKDISDIKFIIPYSCLKFLKFIDENSEQKENIEREAIKNWITNIAGKRTVPVFGIIKADKKSKLMNGEKVFTTYQMLNTLGFNEKTANEFLKETKTTMFDLCTKGPDYVKKYVDEIYFTPCNDQDNYGEETTNISDTFKSFHYKELSASKLLEYDLDYHKTSHYKDVIKSLLGHIKKQVMNGRVMIDGVYAYLFCNGIELLKYSIDKNYDPNAGENGKGTLRNTEIYTKRFKNESKLLCARNPHITMGNYYLATNKHLKIYDEYFVLSNEIVCVNAINSDIMNILNGCDFDSDTMLITNNSIMVDLLMQMLTIHEKSNKFRVPYNSVGTKNITKGTADESAFLAKVDDKLSNNQIGSIVNLSQRLNSLIWMLAPLADQNDKAKYANWRKWNADIGKIYTEGCCTLAVLSNIEIDSAKRSYDCTTKGEIQRVKKLLGTEDMDKLEKYTLWLTDKSNYSLKFNTNDTIYNHNIIGLDPMGYIIKSIIDAEKEALNILPKSSVSNYEFMKKILNKCRIVYDNSNCEESLNHCLKELTKCNKYLEEQNTKSKEKYYKRDYTKDYVTISKCFNAVNRVLNKDTVSSSALLWKLMEIMKDSSRIITTGSEKEVSYFVVGNDEYNQAAKENQYDCPRLLLWGALFAGTSEYEPYLIGILNKESSLE
ncbi:MAG: hypothetical protein K5659_09650 [Lachnospiraceae bacterium]|nr:hypothetical protein [Lachnospiraceae bacterium]